MVRLYNPARVCFRILVLARGHFLYFSYIYISVLRYISRVLACFSFFLITFTYFHPLPQFTLIHDVTSSDKGRPAHY